MKYLRLLPLLALLPTLTACQLRFGDNRYEVPWWVILIAVGAILLLVLVPVLKNTERIWFTCPLCNRKFKPTAARILFAVHANDHRVLKCPHCGKRSMCAPSYDQSEE